MKLTLMLLVGSAAILVGMFALYFAAGAGPSTWLLAKPHYPRALQLVCSPCCGWASARWPGVFPFHTWSPDGHASAPTAVSMLHAGVLMKLGAFGVMRVGMMMLPEGARFWAPWWARRRVNVVYGALSAMSRRTSSTSSPTRR
jgi:NADH-quinone oxidoreductase subunit M